MTIQLRSRKILKEIELDKAKLKKKAIPPEFDFKPISEEERGLDYKRFTQDFRKRGVKRYTSETGEMLCPCCSSMRPLDDFYLHRRKDGAGGHRDTNCHACRKKIMVTRRVDLAMWKYNEMIRASEGLCAICHQPFNPPCIDHCHATGRVRGILCTRCNSGIGQFRDSPELLEAASRYLRKPEAVDRLSKSTRRKPRNGTTISSGDPKPARI